MIPDILGTSVQSEWVERICVTGQVGWIEQLADDSVVAFTLTWSLVRSMKIELH
ncbi:MAG: hypothetical protein ACYTHJ_19100 [Planctomycetota bacterium]|jgi:hypothetical protein